MKKILLILFIALAGLSITDTIYSQPPPPVFPDKPDKTPIDGGLSLLAVAGGAYAIKKLKDRKE